MLKQEKGNLSHSFNCELLPREPLIGIKIMNCQLVDDDGIDRPMFGIEIGLLFLIISYVNVNYSG